MLKSWMEIVPFSHLKSVPGGPLASMAPVASRSASLDVSASQASSSKVT